MKVAPKMSFYEKVSVGRHTLPQRTHTFDFGKFLIIASIVRPNDDVIHIGGIHCDSAHPALKWKSPEEALDKVRSKSADMEVKWRIHAPQYAGCKFAIYDNSGGNAVFGNSRWDVMKYMGEVLNYYDGLVRGGLDANIFVPDAMVILGVSPYMLGKPREYNGCGDPSYYTGTTLVRIQEELLKRFITPHSPTLERKRITIKGAAGKVGGVIAAGLIQKGANLALADIRKEELEKILHQFPHAERISAEWIHLTHAHIFCPADTSTTLPNMKVATDIAQTRHGHGPFKAGIIGPANDQCRDSAIEEYLFKNRVLHNSMNGALENGGGAQAVAAELGEGGFSEKELTKELDALVERNITVATEAHRKNIPPCRIVEEMFLS